MPDEKKRPEDDTVAGYDKDGNFRAFQRHELRDGKLPEGYTAEPPEWAHPNRKDHVKRPEPETNPIPRESGEAGASPTKPPGKPSR